MPLSTDPKINETSEALKETLKGAFHTPPGYRPAHARGILLNGTFKPTPEAAALSSAPHLNAPSIPVIGRFSDSTGIPTIPDNDANSNPKGFAVRFTLPEKDGRRQHTDIIAHSTPFFPVNSGAGFLALLGAIGASSAPDAPKNPSPIEEFLGKTPSALAFVTAPKPFPVSFGTEKYFGVNAFKLISSEGKETFVRYRITPDAGESYITDEEAKGKDAAYLHNEIQTRIIDGGVSFSWWVQIAEEGDITNDATERWPEDRKLVKLGTITLEKVSEDNDEEQRKIIFDPIPRVAGFDVSDDPLLDQRADLYLASGKERRAAGPHHKHILNAQVSIRSPCCRKWFDCAECHAEQENHPLLQSFDMTFICKKCKKAFRKNTQEWEDSDEYCPNCDNHFVIDALTPKAALKIESEDTRVDARMLKDERTRQQDQQTIFDIKELDTKIG